MSPPLFLEVCLMTCNMLKLQPPIQSISVIPKHEEHLLVCNRSSCLYVVNEMVRVRRGGCLCHRESACDA